MRKGREGGLRRQAKGCASRPEVRHCAPARESGPRMRRNAPAVTAQLLLPAPAAGGEEIVRLYRGLCAASAPELERAFHDVATLYAGKHPDYQPCDTEYHDIQHVLDVTLAMARLMDGYE